MLPRSALPVAVRDRPSASPAVPARLHAQTPPASRRADLSRAREFRRRAVPVSAAVLVIYRAGPAWKRTFRTANSCATTPATCSVFT